MEGMLEIILNLKQVRFIKTVENVDSEKVTVNVAGQTELTAGYISNFLTNFKVLNPELVICRLDPDVKVQMELTINKGRGYVPADENRPPMQSSACSPSIRSILRSRTSSTRSRTTAWNRKRTTKSSISR